MILNKIQEEKVKMDYQKEFERVKEGGNYWSPKPGQYKVKALTELEDSEPYLRKHTDGTEESTPQFKIDILVDGEKKVWTIGFGKTLASSHGQLVELATKNNNTLVNVEFSIVVKSDGTKNDYTIVG